MTTLLHLDSSILGPASVSHILSAAVVARFKAADPGLSVVYRDLAADPVPHLSGEYLAAQRAAGGLQSPEMQHDLAMGERVLEEFQAADILVIGFGLYNFTVPSQLKTWIDRILIAGKTFRYTEKGPEGLAGNKKAVLAIARGGFYGPGTPTESFEHGETYMRAVLGFIGIHAPEVVSADGVAISPEQREASIAAATGKAAQLSLAA